MESCNVSQDMLEGMSSVNLRTPNPTTVLCWMALDFIMNKKKKQEVVTFLKQPNFICFLRFYE